MSNSITINIIKFIIIVIIIVVIIIIIIIVIVIIIIIVIVIIIIIVIVIIIIIVIVVSIVIIIFQFSQNGELKEALLATHPKLLVECNPYDCVWGIGLGKTNPAARDKSQWRGKNLLGNILTEYRDKLWAETHSQTH